MANFNPKPGPGRSKGSKNKMTMEMEDFLEMAERHFPNEENHPLANQLMIAKNRTASLELQQKTWNDITSYLIGKKKAIEYSGEINQDMTATEKVSKLSPAQFKVLLDMELDNNPLDEGEDDDAK